MLEAPEPSKCEVCFTDTKSSVGLYNTPKPFRLPLCDDCYYNTDDRAILPIPFGCLWPEGKPWDYMT